jgi:ATP-binding cassette subfamily B protein
MRIPLRRYLSLLITYLKPQWFRTLLMAVFLLANIGLQLLSPQILRYFIDAALNGGASLTLVFAGLLFIIVTLTNQGVTMATSYFSESVAWAATNRLRSDLVTHCLALDMSFHKTRTPGELIERIDGDVDALSNFFSQFVINLLGSILLLVAMLVVYFTIYWLVGVVMTAFSIVALLILMYLRHLAIPLWKAVRQQSAEFSGFLSERLVGTEDIRANGATDYVMRRFYQIVRDWLPLNFKANMAAFHMGSLSLFLFVCGSALALSLGAYLWSLGLATVGTAYLLFAYTDRLSQPISQIQQQLQDLQQAEACIQRIEELLSLTSEVKDGPGVPLLPGAFSVSFGAVAFGYVPDEPVLQDISFQLPPGKVLGLLGRTGSGKTTLARLLFRMYDPQRGEICVGGVSIMQARLQTLRRRIGMVTQDVQLFQASVRDNLTFFDRAIPDQRILEVINDLGLADWYHALPDGLDTELQANGAGLSAGEAQLLAFTRVFLSDPGLVILDEASSRLDPATERLIERAIDKLFKDRTAIVIAHRLATIQRADSILILEDGRILEQGRREDLAQDPNSRLSQLLHLGLEEVMA